MEIKGNTYYFTKPEKNKIKKLIDSKFGKISTPIDYDTTGGHYDLGIEADIYLKTGEKISGSTFERLVGLTGDSKIGVRKSTLEILIKYIDFKDFKQLSRYLEYSINYYNKSEKEIQLDNLYKRHIIKIEYGVNKFIKIRFIASNEFEVIDSRNTKIERSDKLVIVKLEVEEEIICDNVLRKRNKKMISLGGYKSGENNKVSNISFSKKI